MNTDAVDDTSIPALDHERRWTSRTPSSPCAEGCRGCLDRHGVLRPTDCSGWDVRAVLGDLLGMLEIQADPEERARQIKLATQTRSTTAGCAWTP